LEENEVDLVFRVGDRDDGDDNGLGGQSPAKNASAQTGFQCCASFPRWTSAEISEKPLDDRPVE